MCTDVSVHKAELQTHSKEGWRSFIADDISADDENFIFFFHLTAALQ